MCVYLTIEPQSIGQKLIDPKGKKYISTTKVRNCNTSFSVIERLNEQKTSKDVDDLKTLLTNLK